MSRRPLAALATPLTAGLAAGLAATLALGLGAPRIAAAACGASTGTLLGTHQPVPVGCPLYAYVEGDLPVPFPPRLTALRGGSYVDVTDNAASSNLVTVIPVMEQFVNCDGAVTAVNQSQQPFRRYALVPRADVPVGERVGIGEGWFGGLEIVAAGPCPPAEVPQLACTVSSSCFPRGEDVIIDDPGCAAGAGAGPLAALGLLGLRRAASRKASRQRRAAVS